MPSRLRRFASLVALGAVVAATAVSTAGGGYYTPVGGQCVSSGQAYVSGNNSWGVNTVQIRYFCTGVSSAWAELYYIRPNGSQYPHLLFLYQGSLHPVTYVDSRDISYGRAVCKHGGGPAMWFNYCWAGS